MSRRTPPSDAARQRTHALSPMGVAVCGARMTGQRFSDAPDCKRCLRVAGYASTARMVVAALQARELDEEDVLP